MGVISKVQDFIEDAFNDNNPKKELNSELEKKINALAACKGNINNVAIHKSQLKKELDDANSKISQCTNVAKKALIKAEETSDEAEKQVIEEDIKKAIRIKQKSEQSRDEIQTMYDGSVEKYNQMLVTIDKLTEDIERLRRRLKDVDVTNNVAGTQETANDASENDSENEATLARMENEAMTRLKMANAKAHLDTDSTRIDDLEDRFPGGGILEKTNDPVEAELQKMKSEMGLK